MRDYEVSTGYLPGLIGRITQFHGEYYIKHWDFNAFFEARVASELSEYINRYDEASDCTWCLTVDGAIEGSITIDGATGTAGLAHLRWFFLTDKLRGTGAGNQLMRLAMAFCQQKGFKRVYLDTVEGLEAARHLYEKYGFKLVDESTGQQWGTTLREQRFEALL